METASSKIRISPFLQIGGQAGINCLAILHLRRDQLNPIILSEFDKDGQGYEEGKVTNTRFGSFPHTTLIGQPWGSQVRASKVDTGSRGRNKTGKKRKRNEMTSEIRAPFYEGILEQRPKAAVAAQTGFAHLLPPTPEVWTASLPHRTQVVYTPDYSFVLQRLKARPGSQIIEAGAGSGSFSHAAARAVYNGFPISFSQVKGKVWSFEFHKQRAERLQEELQEHGLNCVVEVNHRDVYEDGFALDRDGSQLVQANAVFLDLPAPWLALPHLKRDVSAKKAVSEELFEGDFTREKRGGKAGTPTSEQCVRKGPLSSASPVHICCFLPCIEQVQRTVAALQSYAWQQISVVEVAAQRIEIRRERIGLKEEGLRGVNAAPATVNEAVLKLKEDESRTQAFHQINQQLIKSGTTTILVNEMARPKQDRLRQIQEKSEQRKLYKEGYLIHKAEPELKTHTSYLVFAILPKG